MDRPETLASALEALDAARADVAALNALAAEHKTVVEALNALTVDNETLKAAAASATAQVSELTLALEAAQVSAEHKANAIVANLGVPAVPVTPEAAAPKTSSELWAEYNSLPIEARNEFYAKNREILSK
jgi:hypothetical protein